jgi:hypothetical protein
MKKLILIVFLLIHYMSLAQVDVIDRDSIIPSKNPTTLLLPPSNDEICGAINLANTDCYPRVAANWTSFDNSTATWDVSTPSIPGCWGVFYGATLWYKFTATATSQLITTDYQHSAVNANWDTQIAVYRSSNGLCTGTLTRIGCNEDIWQPTGDLVGNNDLYIPDYFAETTLFGLTIGQTYYIRVDGQYSNDGGVTWFPGIGRICTQVSLDNDRCETAQVASLNTTYPTNMHGAGPISQNDIPDKGFTCGSTENMIYYTFTPTVTDVYYVNQWGQTCTYARGTQFIIYNSAYTCATIPDAWSGLESSTYELYCSPQSTADRNFSINLVAGQTYIIAIDGGRGDECTFNWKITQTTPMPIKLSEFSGVTYSDSILLKWTTLSEFNNHYFSILKFNGTLWKEIGMVEGSGNTSIEINYTFMDKEPNSGYNYYMLKQVDYNGTFTYSNIIAIKNSINAHNSIKYNLLGQYTK